MNSLPGTERLIELALAEDAGLGDLTSSAIFPAAHRSRAAIEAHQDMVICGLEVAARVFTRLEPGIAVTLLAADGDSIKAGTAVMRLRGPTGAILTAERTALNFLQRLSGIATQTRRYVERVSPLGVGIVDTRKTTPGFRALEKYAVRCGGGRNHRSSLGEHVLIKDNHIAAAGSIAEAVRRVRAVAPHLAKIEVEAKSLAEVRAALRAGVEVIMLDNMTPGQIPAAVAAIGGAALIEVSGGVTFETLTDYAVPGVDVISIGALTHSAPAVDLSLSMVRGAGHVLTNAAPSERSRARKSVANAGPKRVATVR